MKESSHSEELKHPVFEHNLGALRVGQLNEVFKFFAIFRSLVVQVEDVAEEDLGLVDTKISFGALVVLVKELFNVL